MSELFDLWRPYRLPPEIMQMIDELRPLIEASEPRALAERCFPLPAIEAMAEAGFFHLSTVKEVGGKSDPLLAMEVCEAVARVSVSAGWNLAVGNMHTAWASAYLPDEALAEVFPSGHSTVLAGGTFPVGKGKRVDGGFRITGLHSWGSGISHANWVLGGFLPEGEDVPLVYVTPKDSVTILDNWNVVGIEGSGSFDYAVEDLFVAESFTFPFLCTEPKRGDGIFALTWQAQGSGHHAAVALGGGQHALETIAALAVRKQRALQSSSLAQRGAFRRDLGEAYVRLNGARDNVARLIERRITQARLGATPTSGEIHELTAAATHSCQEAVDIANMAFRYGGGDSVRLSSQLQRTLRDVLVAQQHLLVADTNFEALGDAIVDRMGKLD